MKSVNNFSLSGRLTADARLFDGKNGKIARFSIAHNFGKGMPVLFADAVMFTSKDCTIPEDILVKGKPVAISGYLRPNVVTKDDVSRTVTDFVVTSCEAIEDEEAEG